jgi:hypothetical protein
MKGRNHLGEKGTGKRILSKLILKKYRVRMWTAFN